MTRATSKARANTARGEAQFGAYRLRPSFENLVAAEEELGPLFALVERAASGQMKLAELAGLFWHCLEERDGLDRTAFSAAVLKAGLVNATPPLKTILGQILGGY